MVTKAPEVKARSVARQAVYAALAFMLVALFCHWMCGTFVDKRGVFFQGIESESEYQRIITLYHGRANADVVPLSQRHDVVLSPEGTSTLVSRIAYACKGGQAKARLNNMWNFPERTRALSLQGRELPLTKEGDLLATLVIAMPDPDAPVQQFILESRVQEETPDSALEPKTPLRLHHEGDRWVYAFQHMYGPPIHYVHVVTLPSEARLVSCEPQPSDKRRTKEGVRLVFKRDLGNGEAFRCRIEYDLIR